MTITLWGRATSSNVQKVVWTLKELGLPYERIDAGGSYGKTDTAEYGRMNPTRLVPTIVDGDVTLWESNAIVRYLAHRYGRGNGRLCPDAWPAYARANQWMDFFLTTFGPAMNGIFLQLIRTARRDRDEAGLKRHVEAAGKAAALLDAALADQPYVAGEAFSMGDIPCGMIMYRYATMPFERPDLPNLARWHARLRERAPFREGVEVSYEPLRHPEA